jgi:hypothetical protein
VYDPAADAFTPTGRLQAGRSAHTATLLPDGTVLLAGGHDSSDDVLSSAELYDPRTGQFALTGDLAQPRTKHAASLLPDGRVLVLGGSGNTGWDGQYASAEIYTPGLGAFAPAAGLHGERFKLGDAAVTLADGRVLVGGGNRQVELFDPATGQFAVQGELDTAYYFSVVTRLDDGRVLISGGYDGDIQPTAKTWLYS